MFSQKRRQFLLITAFVLALLASGAMGCWLDRQILWPRTPDNYVYLQHIYQAQIYFSKRNNDAAIAELNEALRIRPDSFYALQKLALSYAIAGKYSESIKCYRACLQSQPDSVVLLSNLASLLVSCPDVSLRNGTLAVQLAEKACSLTKYHYPSALGTLGAAYAEAGRFSDAIAMAKKASELAALGEGPPWLAERNQELEELYSEHKTYGQFVDLQTASQKNYPYVSLYYYTRHEILLREPNKEKVNLLFLGDSITDNWRNQGSNIWNGYYAPLDAANFGIGGDRAPGVLWRVKNGELANLKPKIIILLIGTNQTGTDSPDQIANDIKALVQEIRARCPESKVLLLAIFPRNYFGDTPVQMQTIQAVNTTIAGLDDGNRVRFLNINDRFLGPDGKVSTTLMPDALHPNEKGYQTWAEAMQPTLAEMLAPRGAATR